MDACKTMNPEVQYWAASHDVEQPAMGTKCETEIFAQHVSAFFYMEGC